MTAWSGFPNRPLVMGILNVTPDSFSDGGLRLAREHAVAAARRMRDAGADIIDIGGESTRPGATPVPPAEEQARVLPVLDALAGIGTALSIDTRNAATMRAALAAGATIVNDVSGLAHDADAPALIAASRCLLVLMHMRGTPETMNTLTHYDDPVGEVTRELAERMDAALAAGIARERIAIDPGIGFAKTAAQSITLLRSLPDLARFGCPILIGVSRKGVIGALSGEADAAKRDAGSLAAGLFALSRGARILRVHDVRGTVQAVRVWSRLA